MEGEQQEVKVDPAYEFEAPKYIEFGTSEESADVGVDEWFGAKEAVEMKTDDLFVSNQDFGTSAPSASHSEVPSLKTTSKKRTLHSGDETERPKKKVRPSIQATPSSNLSSSLNRSRAANYVKTPSTSCSSRGHASKINTTTAVNYSTWVPKLTVPQSPMFATNSRVRMTAVEDSDTMNERYIANSIVNQAKRRRLNSMYKKKALYCSAGYIPSHSTKPLTEPQEFHFVTDDRFGAPQPKTEEEVQIKTLPEWQGATIPQPFVFNAEFRARPTENVVPASPFKSFKQKMLEIQNKTPKRFRTKPRNYVFGQSPDTSTYDLNLTMPQPFVFETSFRTKNTTVLSHEEREALEMQNIPQFRARPVNKRVLESDGQVGISRVPKQPLTEPQGFSLATEGRALVKETNKVAEPEPERFKAKPLDTSVLRGPVKGVHTVERPALTIPESPCLLTKTRYHPPAADQSKEDVFVFKAKPVPEFKAPKPVVHDKLLVEPIPFNLSTEARGKEASAKLAEKLQQERAAEHQAHLFKAQPMIVCDAPVAQMREIVITQPKPFGLAIEQRGEEHKKKFIAKVQDEMKENLERTNFKASLFVPTQPFEAKKSTKQLTVIEDFVLNSDARAVERHVYDIQQDEKAKAAEEVRRQQEQERLVQEAAELKILRAKLIPKAQPIMLGKPFVVHPSAQALTQPHTPKLRTKQRSLVGRDL